MGLHMPSKIHSIKEKNEPKTQFLLLFFIIIEKKGLKSLNCLWNPVDGAEVWGSLNQFRPLKKMKN